MIHHQIKLDLHLLFNFMLQYCGVHREYTDEELANSLFIFVEVLLAKMHTYQVSKGLNQQQLEILAEELGKNLNQTVLLATGVDLKKVYEKETATTGGENGESESS